MNAPQTDPGSRAQAMSQPITRAQRTLRAAVSKRTQALRESEQRFRALFERAAVGVAQIRTDTGQFVGINQKYCDIAGYSREEMEQLDFQTITHPDDLASELAKMELLMAGKIREFTMEKRYLRKDGSLVWVNLTVSPMWAAGAQPDYHIAVVEDITERKRTEAALREQEEFFRLIAENIGDFVAVLDLDGRRLYNSPSYRRLFGGANLHGTNSFAEIHPEDQQRVKQVFRETVQSGIGRQIEYRFVLGDGDIRYMESRGGVIRDEQGRVARVLVVSRDITERRQMEDRVRQLAFCDPLTKLPNRRLFYDRLSQTMAASKRSGCYGALTFLDLDNFKPLNDVHGHEVGDLLLIEAADRLKSCVREMDTVARFGGDEFAVIISELDADKSGSTTRAGIIGEKIRAALAKPYVFKIQHVGKAETTVEHHCTASIGVALFIGNEASQNDILKWADTAMYQAKEAGRNRVCVWAPLIPDRERNAIFSYS